MGHGVGNSPSCELESQDGRNGPTTGQIGKCTSRRGKRLYSFIRIMSVKVFETIRIDEFEIDHQSVTNVMNGRMGTSRSSCPKPTEWPNWKVAMYASVTIRFRKLDCVCKGCGIV